MGFRVLIPQDITEPGKRYLRENGCEIVVLDDASVESICAHAADCDAILARTAGYPREVFRCANRLKVIARHGVGYDNIDVDEATRRGIQVCYTPEANAESVAEHTIALLLACAKRLVFMDGAARNGQWHLRNETRPVCVAGKTLGIIGFGRIGRLAAKKAALGLDMKVIVCGHHTESIDLPDYVRKCGNPDDIFMQSDFVSIHSSLTQETRHMVNGNRLRMMKPTAFLINTARGAEVDEAELYLALRDGRIAGAALDVFETEPADAANPLFRLDNVTVSPHNAALTPESMDRMGLDAAIGIVEVMLGKPVTWPVNRL